MDNRKEDIKQEKSAKDKMEQDLEEAIADTPYKETKKLKIEQAKHDTKEALAGFEFDLSNIDEVRETAAKLLRGEEVSEEAREMLEALKEEYPSFYESESDSDSEGEGGKNLSVEQRVINNKVYLLEEIRVGNNKINLLDRALENPNLGENVSETALGSLTESSRKRRAVSSDEEGESSSKKPAKSAVNESPSDFIDDLPSDYNPFDDIGTD